MLERRSFLMASQDEQAQGKSSQTGAIRSMEKLNGLDRSGLGDKGWAEVRAVRIRVHPEMNTAPSPVYGGELNCPQPEANLATGRKIAGSARMRAISYAD